MKPRNTMSPSHTPQHVPRRTNYSQQRPSIQNSMINGTKITNPIETFTQSIFNSEAILGSSHLQQADLDMMRKPLIKNDQKTVLTLLGNFFGVFDHQPHCKVEIQNIPQMYKLIRYPQPVSKNLFNPVGAKHTWPNCLAIISWISELASYFFKSEDKIVQWAEMDQSLEVMFSEGWKSKSTANMEKLVEMYDNKIAGHEEEETALELGVKEIETAIARTEEGQKSIEWAEDELKKTLELQTKEMTEIKWTENQIKEMKRRSHEHSTLIKEILLKIENEKFQTKKIQRQIDTQVLTVETAQKILDEIEEFKIKASDIVEEQEKKRMEQLENLNNQISQFNKEKLRFDSKLEAIKRNHDMVTQAPLLEEFPINIDILRDFFSPTVPGDSPMLSHSFIYNQHEKTSQIKQLCSEMALNEKHLAQKLEQAQKQKIAKQKIQDQIIKLRDQQKLVIDEESNRLLLLKQQINLRDTEIETGKSQSVHLNSLAQGKRELLGKMMTKLNSVKATNEELTIMIVESSQIGEKTYAECEAKTKEKIAIINEQIKTLARYHYKVNKNDQFKFNENQNKENKEKEN